MSAWTTHFIKHKPVHVRTKLVAIKEKSLGHLTTSIECCPRGWRL